MALVFKKGGNSITIATSAYEHKEFSQGELLPGAFCIGSQGLMELPESKIEPIERSYADGAVFPPTIYRRQNDFTIDILFSTILDGTPILSMRELMNFLNRGTVEVRLSLETINATYNAQCQKIEIIEEKLSVNKPRIVARLYFVGEGYFF